MHAFNLLNCFYCCFFQNIQSIVTTPLKMAKNNSSAHTPCEKTVVLCTQQPFTSGRNYCQQRKKETPVRFC
jgi:hypothetical protein